MKFNKIGAMPFVFSALSIFAVAANAQDAPEFSQADQDQDGVLSIAEAQEALPDLQITDDNGDGVVNHAEAQKTVEGLQLSQQGAAEQESAPVGMIEYRMIVQAMQSSEQDA